MSRSICVKCITSLCYHPGETACNLSRRGLQTWASVICMTTDIKWQHRRTKNNLFLCPGANYLLLTFSAPTIYLLQSPNLNSEAEVPKSFLSRKTINKQRYAASDWNFIFPSKCSVQVSTGQKWSCGENLPSCDDLVQECVCDYVPVVSMICVSPHCTSFSVILYRGVLGHNTVDESKAYVSDTVCESAVTAPWKWKSVRVCVCVCQMSPQ